MKRVLEEHVTEETTMAVETLYTMTTTTTPLRPPPQATPLTANAMTAVINVLHTLTRIVYLMKIMTIPWVIRDTTRGTALENIIDAIHTLVTHVL